MDKTSMNPRPLRKVEARLRKDLEGTTITFRMLGEKYRVSSQALFNFCHRKGIKRPKRPKREHTENCSICQSLIKIAKKPRSEFISSQTIKEELSIDTGRYFNHIGILRKKGLISQRFGRQHSKKAELAYKIYFKKRLPVTTIGKQAGFKNFHSILRQHKALGWDVPGPLFAYNTDERRKRVEGIKRNKRGGRWTKSPG
jgi:hypothetical protein